MAVATVGVEANPDARGVVIIGPVATVHLKVQVLITHGMGEHEVVSFLSSGYCCFKWCHSMFSCVTVNGVGLKA